MIGSQHSKNYLIKINLSVCIVEICKYLLHKRIKYSNDAPDIMNDMLKKKKKYYMTLGTTVVLFQEILKYVYHGSKTI